MAELREFFTHNTAIGFFIYGQAFFAMGLAVALESRRASALTLSASLPFLAAFGLLHAFSEWTELVSLQKWQSLTMSGPAALSVIKLALMVGSAVCLAFFSAKLVADTHPRYAWVGWAPTVLFAVWFVGSELLRPTGHI